MQPTTTIEISIKSIIRIIAVILGIILIWMVSDILFSVIVAIIIASAIDPWVEKLHTKGVPKGVSVLLTYLAALGIIALAIGLIIPPVASEVSQLVKDFPEKYKGFIDFFASLRLFLENKGFGANMENILQNAEAGLSNLTGGFFNVVSGFFGGLFGVLVVIVMSFYFSTSEEAIKKALMRIIPPDSQDRWLNLISKAQQRIGWWFRGQIVLSFAIFLLSFIFLALFKVKYALALAFFAGLLEIVPMIGPIISAIPAVFLTLLYSPVKALLVLILFILIQQFENHVLVPKVMQKSVGLHPIIVIVTMLVGAKLGGITGALVALPIATAADVFLTDIYSRSKEKSNAGE